MTRSAATPSAQARNGLDKADAALLGILWSVGKEVFRTKLVKLTYLLDDLSYRHDYVTLTGFDYQWDNYGPNAVGNQIIKRLDCLVGMGLVYMRQATTPQGSPVFWYSISDKVDFSEIPLTVHDWVLIDVTVREYGDMNRSQIVRASKLTLPMQNATQFQQLEFRRDPKIEALKEKLYADPDFIEEAVAAATAHTGPGITLEELRTKVAQQSIT